MYAEITAAVQSLRTLGELAKAANSLSNQHEIVMAVSEVNAKLMDTMSVALASQERHSALLAKISDLEKEIVELRAKQSEYGKYALYKFNTGMLAYKLKDEFELEIPGHYLCVNCQDNGTHSKLQAQGSRHLKCIICNSIIETDLDTSTNQHNTHFRW